MSVIRDDYGKLLNFSCDGGCGRTVKSTAEAKQEGWVVRGILYGPRDYIAWDYCSQCANRLPWPAAPDKPKEDRDGA